jgi:hypothetical protein
MARCAARTLGLLARRHLHIDRSTKGATVELRDGRGFTVFRDTSCDVDWGDDEVTILVWFHLRATSSASPRRSWLFERESILNTLMFAGFRGYRRKMWMVDRATGDYAGLYTWCGRSAAETYARYITAVLRPLSVRGSVGSALCDRVDEDDTASAMAPRDRR